MGKCILLRPPALLTKSQAWTSQYNGNDIVLNSLMNALPYDLGNPWN